MQVSTGHPVQHTCWTSARVATDDGILATAHLLLFSLACLGRNGRHIAVIRRMSRTDGPGALSTRPDRTAVRGGLRAGRLAAEVPAACCSLLSQSPTWSAPLVLSLVLRRLLLLKGVLMDGAAWPLRQPQ